MTAHPAPTYGGQALVEGVLIRSGSRWAVALRAPSGEIHAYDGELASPSGLWRLPFLRGLRALGTQLRLGMRALADSSMLAETGEIRPIPLITTLGLVAVSLLIGLFVFSAIPLLLTGRDPLIEPTLPQRLAEGLIKGTLLAAYVVGVTRLPRYRRIFSYHGAEHMAIACAEAGRAADAGQRGALQPGPPALRDGLPGHPGRGGHAAAGRAPPPGPHGRPGPARRLRAGHRGHRLRAAALGRAAAAALASR